MNISQRDKIADDKIELLIKDLLFSLGSKYNTNLDNEVIECTPNRIRRAYDEICAGYAMDPEAILSKRFKGSSGMVIEGNIEFVSTCEHHMLPFYGKAIVAYIPQNQNVVGISKLARIVECYGRRLQLQERMTGQIADAIVKHLSPDCAVFTEAIHSCMIARGIKKKATTIVTSLRGEFEKEVHVKQEFLSYVGRFKHDIL